MNTRPGAASARYRETRREMFVRRAFGFRHMCARASAQADSHRANKAPDEEIVICNSRDRGRTILVVGKGIFRLVLATLKLENCQYLGLLHI